MKVRTAARYLVAPIAGGSMLFVALSLTMPSVAGAVPPPSRPSSAGPTVVGQEVPVAQVVGEEPVAPDLSRQELVQELDAARLSISRDGSAILSDGAGLGSPRQLVLAQLAADRFGIAKNPFFDPSRVAVVRDGGAIADLTTGVILGHGIGSAMFGTTEVIAMDLLEELRARAGWSLTQARKDAAGRYATLLDGYVPVAFQTDEAYARYLEAARANYRSIATAS